MASRAPAASHMLSRALDGHLGREGKNVQMALSQVKDAGGVLAGTAKAGE